MLKFLLLLFVACLGLQAQTPVYLPAGPPTETYIVSPGCPHPAATAVCTVTDATGLASGDVVGIWGVASSATNHMSSVRGLLKIRSISGNLLTLENLDHSDLPTNGTWETGANATFSEAASPQHVRKMTALTAVVGPKGVLDGWNGPVTRSWALGTHNGLVSLIVSSNVATVTTSFNLSTIGVASGQKVTVWNTTNATFTPSGGREFSPISVTGATTYTFPVTIGNGDYTHNDTCGPGVTPNGTVQGTDNCVRISSRATSTNAWWVAIQGFSSSPTTIPFLGTGSANSQYAVFCALRFLVDQKAQAYLDYAMKHINQLEVYGGNSFPASETVNDGGNYTLAAQVSQQMQDVAEAYSIVREYLTPSQKQAFLDKAMNDISDPASCTKNLPNRVAFATGTFAADDLTHITLDAGASAVDGFYVGSVVEAENSGGHSAGAISAYNGTTKVATLNVDYLCPGLVPCGWDSGNVPNTPSTYTIWESFGLSASTGTATAADATHLTLIAASSTITDFYNDNIVKAVTGAAYSIGRITAYNATTKQLTVTGWDNGTPSSSATYSISVGFSSSAASGTATAADATHLTLAVGSSSGTTNFYVGDIVEAVSSGVHSEGQITAYNGTTKQATVTGWDHGTPSGTATYQVWAGFSDPPNKRLTPVTLTGYKTHWNTPGPDQLVVGDFIFGVNRWAAFLDPGGLGAVVTAVTDDTTITVFSPGLSLSPKAGWITHAWASGDCGDQWIQNHYVANFGSQSSQYPPRAGNSVRLGDNIGGGLASFMLAFFAAMVDDDPRAVTNLARYAVMGMDENLGLYMSYMGLFFSGSSYGPGRATQGAGSIAWTLSKSFTGLPSFDLSGPWIKGFQEWKQYGLYPDVYLYPKAGDSFNRTPDGYMMAMDFGIAFDPTSTASKYTKYFLDSVLHLNTSSSVGATGLHDLAVRMDPNTVALDYKAQPLQYILTATSRPAALALGWNHPATWRGDVLMSRTGWTHTYDTVLWYGSRTYVSDHDAPQPGDLQVYKTGYFLANDDYPPGDITNNGHGPYLEFGGASTLRGAYDSNGPAVANIIKSTGTVPYGDANSNYVCVLSDLAGAYTTTLTRAWRTVCHFKKTGAEEIIVTFADVVTPSSTIIRDQLYYTQNGDAAMNGAFGQITAPEGATTYPGSGGCASLNTNRTVLSQQDGLSTGAPTPLIGTSAPVRQYNMISKFLSPGTITLSCEGSAVGVPSGATGYSASTGHAERVSIYGGSSVGGTATSLESIAVHKIATQPDTSLTATAMNPDANWTGVNTTDKVALFARGGVTRSTMAASTVTLASPGQVLIAGLTAGSYTLTVGSFNCGTITVVDGDNTAECETTGTITGGTLSLNGAAGTSHDLFPMPMPVKR